MKFELIIDPTELDMYGNVPCLPVDNIEGKGERFTGEESDSWILLEDFVSGIDPICSNVLDYGDVDYFDSDKCKVIIEWLIHRMSMDITPRLQYLYKILLDYMSRAVELNTGVVIGL